MEIKIIPMPKCAEYSDEKILPDLNGIEYDGICADTGKAFAGYCKRLGFSGGDTPVSLSKCAKLGAEEYEISADKNGIKICASGNPGFQHAFATVFQLMNKCGGYLPGCKIHDVPDRPYRTVMVDLARNWHEPHYVYEYIDLCWLFKIRYLHLHFTDDQSYTLPSKLFPKLSTEGRHYSEEDIKGFIEYADARGVGIVPEIDVPGHSTPFVQNYPEVFGNIGIVAQTERSMTAMSKLFAELCDTFKSSEYIHIGGDEAAIINWTNHPECREYAKACGIDFDMEDKRLLSERLLANFVQKMGDVVKEHGKTAIAWEGFGKCVNQYVSRDIIMVNWENFYQLTPELLEAGFKIINGSWCPMYVVTPVAYWSLEEVFEWSIYRWRPVHPQSPYNGTVHTEEPNGDILGGMLLAWGDAIPANCPSVEEGVKKEQELMEERTAILAEHTWNVESTRKSAEFISDIPAYKELISRIKA